MEKELLALKNEAIAEIAKITDQQVFEAVRIRYMGSKGLLPQLSRKIGDLSESERPNVGKLLNEVKAFISSELASKFREITETAKEKELTHETSDLTLPGCAPLSGHLHPVTLVMQEIEQIFSRLGFKLAFGPEVETDYYNLEALNFSADHPARDMQATFYLDDKILLRTHTSPVQIRVMEKQKPPLRIIAMGKCFRRDAMDASHSPVFHQVEGLMVDKKVTFSDLKGIMELFFQEFFDPGTKVRLTPSFFPFTEPSAETSVLCTNCKGSGCSVCKKTGWLEIFGSGMVNPEVFRNVGYDPETWSGFAFGGGIERLAMLKYGIDDIRLFYENDIRFIKQFG